MKKNFLPAWSPLMLTALLATGCAVGPDYVRPELPQPATLTREALPTAGQAPVASAWWEVFGQSELNALVQQGLDHSPTIAAATANLRAARENVVAQRGYFYPTVQASYSPARQNSGQFLSSPLDSGDTLYTLNTAQLNVSFVPDVFGSNRRQVEGVQAQADGEREQLRAARITLANNLVAAALMEATLTQQIQLTQQAIDVAQEQLRHMRKQHAQGYANGIDLATQETLLTQMQQELPALEKQHEQTRNLIAVLIGQTPDAATPRLSLEKLRLPALPAALPSQVVAERPDIRAAEAQLRAANAAIGVAKAARLPQLSLNASYGGSATRFADMFSSGNIAWGLGASILQPLFAGGTLAAQQRSAQALFEAAAAQYRQTVLEAFQNVADSLYAIDVDTRALRMAEANEAANRKVYELTRKQLDTGYASRPAMLATQQAYLQSSAARVAAYGTLLGDTVALYQSLGGGTPEPQDSSPP